MKGNTHESRRKLSFQIRWAGYGQEDDTWESWDNCKNSSAVQTFLREHSNKRIRQLAKSTNMETAIEENTNITENYLTTQTSEISQHKTETSGQYNTRSRKKQRVC